MAIATLPPGLGRLRGRLGPLVFRHYRGKTVVSRCSPPARNTTTARQLEVRLRFQLAAAYARAALADPPRAAFYASLAAAKKKPVFALAIGDFFQAPEINLIDTDSFHGHVGESIGILATDDAGVTRVTVSIKDMTGTLLEQGDATGNGSFWQYWLKKNAPAGEPLTIEAIAFDRPNNTGTKTVPWVPSNGREASPPSRTTPSLIT